MPVNKDAEIARINGQLGKARKSLTRRATAIAASEEHELEALATVLAIIRRASVKNDFKYRGALRSRVMQYYRQEDAARKLPRTKKNHVTPIVRMAFPGISSGQVHAYVSFLLYCFHLKWSPSKMVETYRQRKQDGRFKDMKEAGQKGRKLNDDRGWPDLGIGQDP